MWKVYNNNNDDDGQRKKSDQKSPQVFDSGALKIMIFNKSIIVLINQGIHKTEFENVHVCIPWSTKIKLV